jgi:hypothetical protein
MNDRITPSPELVNKVIDSISKPPKKYNLIKYAIPMLLILSVFCLPLMNNSVTTDNGNWFTLVAYAAENTTFEITKDVKVVLPAGNIKINPRENGGFAYNWYANCTDTGEYIPGGFEIIGENIESVYLKSKYGSFLDTISEASGIYKEYDRRLKRHAESRVNPIYLEGEDILNLSYFVWQPDKLIKTTRNGKYREGDIEKYKDIIKVKVKFNNGDVIEETIEITIDEDTGDIYAQIIE